MLEAATWRTANRRHFAVLERLYREAGRPLRNEGWDPADDRGYAARLVHMVGSHLLSTSIDAGMTKDGKSSIRRNGKAWKTVSDDTGARASVFLTLAVAAILSPEVQGEEVDEGVITEARHLVESTFTVPDKDLAQIEQVKASVVETLNDPLTKEAVERGGLADAMAIQNGQTILSYHAMKMAGVAVDDLPAFEPVRGVSLDLWHEIASFDWLLTFSISFDARWKQAKQDYVDIAYTRARAGNVAFQLVESAFEAMSEGSWQWDTIVGVTVVKTGDKLSNFREEYNLVLDAIALGYCIRRAEIELADGSNTFDADYSGQLRAKFEEADDPDAIIAIGMNQAREDLPAPFAPGPEIWSEVLELAIPGLEERGAHLLAETPEFDEEGDISRDMREFALGLGYGLAVTVDALGIEGTQPRE